MRKQKRVKARNIVTLAVTTALCVVANEVCARTIPLHAGTSMVILSGISLGAGPGFLVGMLARFVVNFFEGQGPWTIFQMLSWGLLGAISAICFQPVKRETLLERKRKKKLSGYEIVKQFRENMAILLCIVASLLLGMLVLVVTGREIQEMIGWRLYFFGVVGLLLGCILKRKKLEPKPIVLAVYTFCVVFILYGGIMNFATLLLSYVADREHNAINLETLKVLYFTGVPYDLGHAVGAAICIFLIGESFLQKMERIQIKYHIF